MRTKQEINEKIEIIKNEIGNAKPNRSLIDTVDYNMGDLIISALQWVLEDSKPKRTIFDLTENELKELFFTAIPSQKDNDLSFCNYSANEDTDYIEFQLKLDDEDLWIVHIFTDLSFFIYCGGTFAIEKPIEYSDKIREMLSK